MSTLRAAVEVRTTMIIAQQYRCPILYIVRDQHGEPNRMTLFMRVFLFGLGLGPKLTAQAMWFGGRGTE